MLEVLAAKEFNPVLVPKGLRRRICAAEAQASSIKNGGPEEGPRIS